MLRSMTGSGGLPFVMGVLADLSGKPAEPLPPVADRKFLEIDIDNFDERMKALKPRVAFAVNNTLTGEGRRPLAAAEVVVEEQEGNPLEFLKITMSDVLVTQVAPGGSTDDKVRSRETVSLSFAKVKQEYVVQNAQGGSGGAVTAGYDIKGNKEA